MFTDAYVFIPRGVMMDIVTSLLPYWEKTRAWVLARPLSGFAETFSQYMMEVAPDGGSERPELDPGAEGALFILEGTPVLTIEGEWHHLRPGNFAFIPPGSRWSLHNDGRVPARFHWFRKAYEPVDGIPVPKAFVVHESEIQPYIMPDTAGAWATTRFFDGTDISYDMHVTINSFLPGTILPFAETHVMEHGLYILEGKGVFRLNQDWLEVQEGDFVWLRAFCPQASYAGGPGPLRYLLYKDVNRHMKLHLGGPLAPER